MVSQLRHKICGLESYGVNKCYVCLDGCYMYVSPGEHNKLAMEEPIPVGTILEREYFYNYFTYTTYNGVSGWIVDIDMMTYSDKYSYSKVAEMPAKSGIITIKKALLYDKPLDNANAICYVPQNTEFDSSYLYGYFQHGHIGYVGVNYDNQIGWIPVDECAFEAEPYSQTLEFAQDLIIGGKVAISSGEIVKLYSKYSISTIMFDDCECNYYFSYNGYNFLLSDVYKLSDLVESSTNDLIEVGNGTIDIEEQIKQSGETSTSGEDSGEEVINIFDIQNQKKEQSNINMAILCICGAVVLALTAVVIIILANKKMIEVSKKNIITEKDVEWKETEEEKDE